MSETNQEIIGRAAMEALERFEEDFGADVKVTDVVVLAEIEYDDEDGERTTSVPYYATTPRPSSQLGILMMAALNVWSPKEE